MTLLGISTYPQTGVRPINPPNYSRYSPPPPTCILICSLWTTKLPSTVWRKSRETRQGRKKWMMNESIITNDCILYTAQQHFISNKWQTFSCLKTHICVQMRAYAVQDMCLYHYMLFLSIDLHRCTWVWVSVRSQNKETTFIRSIFNVWWSISDDDDDDDDDGESRTRYFIRRNIYRIDGMMSSR